MKECSVFNKKLCLGCAGLGEQDWTGAEQCEIYKKLRNTTGLDICKRILKGENRCQMKI